MLFCRRPVSHTRISRKVRVFTQPPFLFPKFKRGRKPLTHNACHLTCT
nr:MAG TPA: hypothetical protein [Caudoviricetes sp.]